MGASKLRQLQRHFDGIAEAYYEIVDRVWYEYGYFHERESRFLQRALATQLTLAIDAGCGPGRHTVTLAHSADKVVALDISREMLRLARRAASESTTNVEFVQADLRHMPLKSSVANLVVTLEVLEHLPGGRRGIVAALSECRRVLRHRGRLITEAPLRWHDYVNLISPPSLKEVQGDSVRVYYERAPLVIEELQDDKEIEEELVREGFTIAARAYVRVLPSGMIERHPRLAAIDAALEKVPLIGRLAREVIWLAQAV